ncbi:hypothetical protein PROFUN_10234 [Planoprotostelium fungivorum]|uniref:Uncharacterized protein n=1 Tax=Planoprotostelium fungivorum TaxID=1890364 RepID=A0A2P6NEE9_9EUKA|nr:hypothetical protein PROFUN_10234 [Planoprotostelium fungivorum]
MLKIAPKLVITEQPQPHLSLADTMPNESTGQGLGPESGEPFSSLGQTRSRSAEGRNKNNIYMSPQVASMEDEKFWRKRAPTEAPSRSRKAPFVRGNTTTDLERVREKIVPPIVSLTPTIVLSAISSPQSSIDNSNVTMNSPRPLKSPRLLQPLTVQPSKPIERPRTAGMDAYNFSTMDTSISEYSYRLAPIAELPARMRRSVPLEKLILTLDFPYLDL